MAEGNPITEEVRRVLCQESPCLTSRRRPAGTAGKVSPCGRGGEEDPRVNLAVAVVEAVYCAMYIASRTMFTLSEVEVAVRRRLW